jgi:hypothetical protein
MTTTKAGRPGDPTHTALLARHFALIGDRRRQDRRQDDRRREPAGIAGVAGLDRRRVERRKQERRVPPRLLV